MDGLAARARTRAFALVFSAAWVASAYQCRTDVDLGPAVRPEKKGIALDDNTLRWCSSQIPERWPNANEPMTSLRLFRAWDPLWSESDRLAAWANLETYVKNMNAKVFIGTQITCNETADADAWYWTKELMQRLHPEHVMGLAIGNELELLQFKGSNLVAQVCIDKVWEEGYLWRRYQEFTAEFDAMGFGSVPVTSVFTGLGLGGVGDVPFYEKPGQARVNSFIKNATQLHGSRFAFTWNFYPYFDPNFHLDAGGAGCSKTLTNAICLKSDCNVPKLVREARIRQRWMTGSTDGLLWVGEVGWSSPMSSTLKTRMRNCEEWSSLDTFKRFYELFLNWDLEIGDLPPPDHVFWFTMRDSLNFGNGEHFGLIETCDDPACKVRSADYKPQEYVLHNGPAPQSCGDETLYNGWSTGNQNCRDKCSLDERCNFYGSWPHSHDGNFWCRLTATCDIKEADDRWVNIYRKATGAEQATTTLPAPASPTTQAAVAPATTVRPQDPVDAPGTASTTGLAMTSSAMSTTTAATTAATTTVNGAATTATASTPAPAQTSAAPGSTTTLRPTTSQASSTAAATPSPSTTAAAPPATAAPTTAPAPATEAPTTAAPSTAAPTTAAPTTAAPTTAAPTTEAPTTAAPTTAAPTTALPTTAAPTTAAPSPIGPNTTARPPAPTGHCEFENMPLFPGFFWDPTCEPGMLGCNADGINTACRFCGGGSYVNISCPHTSCTFVHEPFVPYYWDDSCHSGMEGCWADGVHAQCRFCGRFPFTNIPCPTAPAPPASETSAAACSFENVPEMPFFVDETCRHGMKGCLADGVHMSCRFCGEGEYEDIPCPVGPQAERCTFGAEPTTPYYWDTSCHMGMLGCMADGVNAQCRFCAQRPFEHIPCPDSPFAPEQHRCRFPDGIEPEVAHYWDPDCTMGVLGCWADGIHPECRFCGGGAFHEIPCPDSVGYPTSTSTTRTTTTTATTPRAVQERAQRPQQRPQLIPLPQGQAPAKDLAAKAPAPTPSGAAVQQEDEDLAASGAVRQAVLSLGVLVALGGWLEGRFC